MDQIELPRILLKGTWGGGWAAREQEKKNPPPLKSWLQVSDERASYPTKTDLKLLSHIDPS